MKEKEKETTEITKTKSEMEQENKFLLFFFTHKMLQAMDEYDKSKLKFNPDKYKYLLN